MDVPPLFRYSVDNDFRVHVRYRCQEKGKHRRLHLIESYRRPGMSYSLLGRDKTVNYLRREVAKLIGK